MCNGQVATNVVDTCGAPLITNILRKFLNINEGRAKLIHEKN
jgi:hypothetical protein